MTAAGPPMRARPAVLAVAVLAGCNSGDGEAKRAVRERFGVDRLAQCRRGAPADVPIPNLEMARYCACAADVLIEERAAGRTGILPERMRTQGSDRSRALYRRCARGPTGDAPPAIFDPETGALDMWASEGQPSAEKPPPA